MSDVKDAKKTIREIAEANMGKSKIDESELVFLDGVGIPRKGYTLKHAQDIIDLGKRNPPQVFKLSDDQYEMKSGKITFKEVIAPTIQKEVTPQVATPQPTSVSTSNK